MNIAWLIFILFAYFGFEDPLKKRKEKEKCVLEHLWCCMHVKRWPVQDAGSGHAGHSIRGPHARHE